MSVKISISHLLGDKFRTIINILVIIFIVISLASITPVYNGIRGAIDKYGEMTQSIIILEPDSTLEMSMPVLPIPKPEFERLYNRHIYRFNKFSNYAFNETTISRINKINGIDGIVRGITMNVMGNSCR